MSSIGYIFSLFISKSAAPLLIFEVFEPIRNTFPRFNLLVHKRHGMGCISKKAPEWEPT